MSIKQIIMKVLQGLVVGSTLLTTLPARAQTTTDINELKAEVNALKQIVEQQRKALEQVQAKQTSAEKAVVATPVAAKKEGAALITAGWDKNRPVLRSADGNFEAAFGGFAHFDFRGYSEGTHPANTFLIRRARLFVDGKLAKYFEYKIEADFADTANTILRDGWVRVHRWDAFQIQAGQFKEPFSQEELRSDQAQDFTERSMVNFLAPARSPGIMVLGNVGKGIFEYQAGLFNGKGLLAANTTGTPESAFRLRFTPAKHSKNEWINAFSFGGAMAFGRNGVSTTGVRGQTESRSTTFYAADTVKGSYYRANGELNWVKGPAALRSEYVFVSQNRAGLGAAGVDLPSVDSNAFNFQATYLLTGEKKPDNGAVVPKHSLFDGGNRSLGAWELKFRYAFLDVNNHTVKANRARSYYFGTNWYMNRFVKNVFDVGIESFRDPLRAPNVGSSNYFVVLNRIQVAF